VKKLTPNLREKSEVKSMPSDKIMESGLKKLGFLNRCSKRQNIGADFHQFKKNNKTNCWCDINAQALKFQFVQDKIKKQL
jgi:hypothetical protein